MKRILWLSIALVWGLLLFKAPLYAQDSTNVKATQHKKTRRVPFVDKNGDGYNDLLPDHDGDGIPDIMDPDWHKKHAQKGHHRFIDLDGDGINDLIFSGKGQHEVPKQMEMRHEGKWKDRSGAMGEEGGNMRGHHRGKWKGKK